MLQGAVKLVFKAVMIAGALAATGQLPRATVAMGELALSAMKEHQNFKLAAYDKSLWEAGKKNTKGVNKKSAKPKSGNSSKQSSH